MRRSEYLKASPPMFESELLDRFTRVHPAVPALIYLPVIALLFGTGVGRVGALSALGLELHRVPAPAQALHRHLVVDARHHDLAVAGFGRLLDGQQVAIKNARVFHAQATHAQQVIRRLGEQGRGDANLAFDMLGSQNRATGSHATNNGQQEGISQIGQGAAAGR